MAVYLDVNPDLKSRVDQYLSQYVVNRHQHEVSAYWKRRLQNYQYRIAGRRAVVEGYFNVDDRPRAYNPSTKAPSGIKAKAAKLYRNIRDELLTKRLCSQYGSGNGSWISALVNNCTAETIFHLLTPLSSQLSMGIVNRRRQGFYQHFNDNYKHYLERSMPSIFDNFSDYEIAKTARLASGIKGLFNSLVSDNKGLRVLEIGAGGCLLCVLLQKMIPIISYDIIDLPEMIPTGFLIAKHFDDSLKVQLPGESIDNPQIKFFVPGQYEPEGADIDLGINITSFQEMNDQLVSSYFALLSKAVRLDGLLFCVNRLRKETNFMEYPWEEKWRVISTEEDPLSRLHRADRIIIRRVATRV